LGRYKQLIQGEPPGARLLTEFGDTLLQGHRDNEALAIFREALWLDPQNAGTELGLARTLATSGSYSESLQHYEEALKLSPDNYDALQGQAYVLCWSHQLEHRPERSSTACAPGTWLILKAPRL
jgi:cytochrome c-type biogenesis protein CcmH/NrfG